MCDKSVKMGLIGLGSRGFYLMNTIIHMEEIEISAICDIDQDEYEAIFPYFDRMNKVRPGTYTDYRELLKREDIEGVIIATNRNSHTDIAIASMKAGKWRCFA
ncbi:Gfo/Idh/MocA family protein [Paenibacillus contaminans]|uniref:Gfo/Idh/MocA-like oxidoreductase N-terminal domain-containing protein n=1 Tax=Paenibacillus contaminans TaxID=450362 RepID=A0A329M8Z5_9BACL|nr:Gfo/Idh/MocA family oxidoreductase [Paenibacillus contaminans]RAV15626.1 hypothetical protein DQG23_30085 [Paenibacillus contaminans]